MSRILGLSRRLVRIVSRLVPERHRGRWYREWDAEQVAWWQREAQRPGAGRALLKRALLSPLDAVVVRRLALQTVNNMRDFSSLTRRK